MSFGEEYAWTRKTCPECGHQSADHCQHAKMDSQFVFTGRYHITAWECMKADCKCTQDQRKVAV